MTRLLDISPGLSPSYQTYSPDRDSELSRESRSRTRRSGSDYSYIIGCQLRAAAALAVHGVRDRFKMVRIAAAVLTAEVVKFATRRHGAMGFLPPERMGMGSSLNAVARNFARHVTIGVRGSIGDPARSLVAAVLDRVAVWFAAGARLMTLDVSRRWEQIPAAAGAELGLVGLHHMSIPRPALYTNPRKDGRGWLKTS